MPTLQQKEKSLNDLIVVFDSNFFKALSEPTRVEILKILILNGKLDIQGVALKIQKDRSVLSRHLHLLVEAGILKSEKTDRRVFFEINGESFLNKIQKLLSQANKAIQTCCHK